MKIKPSRIKLWKIALVVLAGIGLAAGLLQPENAAAWHGAVDQGKLPTKEKTVDTAGLGAVGGYAGLASYTSLGGTLTVFALPSE